MNLFAKKSQRRMQMNENSKRNTLRVALVTTAYETIERKTRQGNKQWMSDENLDLMKSDSKQCHGMVQIIVNCTH